MLKFRAISFPLLLLLAGLVVFWEPGGPWLFTALAFPVAAMAVLEAAAIAGRLGIGCFRAPAVIGGWLLLATAGGMTGFFGWDYEVPAVEIIFWLFPPLCSLLLLLTKKRKAAAAACLGTAGTAAFALAPVLALSRIYFDCGAMIFLVLVLVTKAADTGGYIVGMLANKLQKNGNHKIAPSISPKKSWEGTIGGLLFSLGAAWIFNACGVLVLPLWGVLFFGALAFFGSFAGDLTESQLKRAAGIKDSGKWIPGMGGALDVLDSFIYNAPLFLAALETGLLNL